MTNEGGKTCPVCTEEMDLTDLQLKPCKCGYEICVWCWHNVVDMAERDGTEGRCPACRTPYDKERIVSMTASVEINSERKPKPQKAKSRAYDGRKHLSNVRVLQHHLVYTMGLPAHLADEDVLQRREYFGQYGKVLKASLSRTSGGAIQYTPNNTCSVYITYSKEEEAVRCILALQGFTLQGQPLRVSFGTTKYCHAWLRNMPCGNPDCVYLHDVGNQEDSFTKDDTVSNYTRNYIVQNTGAFNFERRSGNVLPPPLDEPCISVTASSKPLSRSPSDNHSTHLKVSPPNSSSGRSISLPAAASWGLRASNGHSPTGTSASSNEPSKQRHEDCNGSAGFPSLVPSTTPASMLHIDVGKKTWVTKEVRASHSSKELGSLVVDHQIIVPDALDEVDQDAAATDITSRYMPGLATPRDDNCVDKLSGVACSEDIDRQSLVAYSDMNGNVAIDGRVQSECSGLSAVGIGNYLSNNHSDGTEPNPSAKDQLFESFRDQHQQQSYPQHVRGNLTSLPPRKAVPSEGVFLSSELSNWGSESQTQVLRDTCGALDDDSLALGEQNSIFSEVCHPLYIPGTTSPINISSSSNGHPWAYDHACGTSDPICRDPRALQTKADEVLVPYTSSDSVMSNGYLEKNISTSSGLDFERSNFISSVEKGKYSGGFNSTPANFEKNTSVDMGESNIISNILSMDFDAWDESPHNFAKLLSATDKKLGGLNVRSSRKEQNSSQSRFSFARHADFSDQGTDSDLSRNIGSTMNTNSASKVFQGNQSIHLDEFPGGISCNFIEESDSFYSGNSNISPSRFSVLRAPVSAPPGFSVPSKIPPPGFSVQERMDKTFDAAPVNHFLGSTSLLRSQYHVPPPMEVANTQDVELIDPAILEVGTGRPANAINDFLDFRSTPALQLGASENDTRFQLLRQNFLPAQPNFRYSDHIGDRFSPLTDAYNTPSGAYNTPSGAYNNPSRYLDQSQYAQLPFQPRTERVSHGWNWNETQSGNDLGMVEFLKNERFGFNQYFPDYENRNSRMPKPSDLYNKAFGM